MIIFKTFTRYVVLIAGIFLSAVTLAHAQAELQTQTLPAEAIVSYDSLVTVNVDNSVRVLETITYNTGPQEHHGIYRDIYPFSSQNRKMDIAGVTVTDETGAPHQFTLSKGDRNTRIKIGDPNRTFAGQKVYVISYRATRAVGQFDDLDEIYWNVTGNEWGMPIYQARATVSLPAGATIKQSACYYGPKGSTNKCQMVSEEGGINFNAPAPLNPGDGLTVAVGFPKGLVTPYTAADDAKSALATYWSWIISALLPLLTLIGSLWYWYRKGRDPKGTGVIIPQYDVLDNLTPMEVGGIVNEKVDTNALSAQIIYLATKGYLQIRQIEGKIAGFIKTTDYELVKLKDYSDLPNAFDQTLLQGLFTPLPLRLGIVKDAAAKDQVVKLSELRNVFYKDAARVVNAVLDSLLVKGYYKNLGRMKGGPGRVYFLMFMSLWVSGFFGIILGSVLLRENPLPMVVGIFVSIVIYGIVSHFNPAKTDNGVAVKEYLLGLKMYLQIAEKDRLQFHNAPEKKPEVFETLLPFAMVLGVAPIWAKEFEGIYTVPPSWYSGPLGSSGAPFSTVAFSNSMMSFNSFAASTLSSSPKSSGSGSSGGGFSGGGGGGGGGGSW